MDLCLVWIHGGGGEKRITQRQTLGATSKCYTVRLKAVFNGSLLPSFSLHSWELSSARGVCVFSFLTPQSSSRRKEVVKFIGEVDMQNIQLKKEPPTS